MGKLEVTAEIEMMQAIGLSFAEWCQLEPPPASLSDGSGMMYVRPPRAVCLRNRGR
jgi:hypothetical protein